MILFFHLSKYFLKNLKIIFKTNYTRRLSWKSFRRLTISQKTQPTFRGYIRKNELCFFLFDHKGLCVISQGF